jgi:hypothetical protein
MSGMLLDQGKNIHLRSFSSSICFDLLGDNNCDDKDAEVEDSDEFTIFQDKLHQKQWNNLKSE